MGTLAIDIRDRLGPAPELEGPPLVSIVVLNRDGVQHLRRLLAGLVENTDYAPLELIVVDNGSSDESLEFIRSVRAPFPVSIVANPHNESFSDANNQGAELASGELLLFLNNDTEPFEAGWLRELVACWRETGAGAVGATLVCPDVESDSPSGYGVQSQPLRLWRRSDALTVDSGEPKRELLDRHFGEDVESAVLIGACLLIESKVFWEVGGFTHGYFYGGEDDDLALKLHEQGHRTLYSGRSILIHHVSSTSRELHGGKGALQRGNRLLLVRRWGPRIWREWALGRLSGGNLWAAPEPGQHDDPASREEALALGFCLSVGEPTAGEDAALEALEAELGRRGHRCLALRGNSNTPIQSYLYDVAVYVRGTRRDLPAPGQLNALWAIDQPKALTGIECRRYDLVVTSNAGLARRLGPEAHPTPVVTLGYADPAGDLISAVLTRAEQLDFPTRIEPEPALR